MLGENIDQKPQVTGEDQRSIHRKAPDFVDLSTTADLLETGIKVVDLLAPVLK